MKFELELLRFPLDDEEWQQKAITGGLLSLFGFVLFPLLWVVRGYGLRVLRITYQEGQPRLPEWDDWGELFAEGFQAWLVEFLYIFPAALLVGIASVPSVLAAVTDVMSENALATQLPLLIVCQVPIYMLTVPLGIGGMYLAQVAIARMAVHESFAAAMDVRNVWELGRRGFRSFVIAVLLWYALSYAASFITSAVFWVIILICITPFLSAVLNVYVRVMGGAFLGLAYRAVPAADTGDMPAAGADV